jgi:hypothetical protein
VSVAAEVTSKVRSVLHSDSRKKGDEVNRYEAIIEFGKILLDHIRIDGCNRNREQATETMKLLAKCLIDEVSKRE